jgi:hypothetical protein
LGNAFPNHGRAAADLVKEPRKTALIRDESESSAAGLPLAGNSTAEPNFGEGETMTMHAQLNASCAPTFADVQPLNHAILELGLGDLEGAALDQRIETSLAALFGPQGGLGDLVAEAGGCEYFICHGYWPED